MAPLPPFETMAVALTMAPLFADTFPNDANGRGEERRGEGTFYGRRNVSRGNFGLSGITRRMRYAGTVQVAGAGIQPFGGSNHIL